MKEKGKTWLARKLSIGKVAEKGEVPNQREEDRVEIDEEDGRKNDSTSVSPSQGEQSPVIARGGLLSYPVTPERGALSSVAEAAGSSAHYKSPPSNYSSAYPESTKSDRSDELKEHLDTVKSSLEEILASGYQNNASKSTGTLRLNYYYSIDFS
jgi:transcription elongation factor